MLHQTMSSEEKQQDGSRAEAEINKANHLKAMDSSNLNTPNNSMKPILVLINPHSGQGKSVSIYKRKLLPFLNAHNIEHQVFITESDSRVSDHLANKTLLELVNLRSILVVSGDGLFHEVVNALMKRADWEKAMAVPIGIVPTGSGNGLAYTLLRQKHPELDNKDEVIRICCEQAIRDQSCLADLVKITFGQSTIWSFLSFGWGLLADIDIDSEWLRRLGEFRFTVYGLLRSITSVSYRGRLSFKMAPDKSITELDSLPKSNTSHEFNSDATSEANESDLSGWSSNNDSWVHIEDRFACLYAVYQSYVSSVTKFAPKSTLTDQLIYLTYIKGKLSPCRVIEFLLAIEDGSHEHLPYVTVVPVTNFKFQPLDASKIVVDGEVIPWNLSDGPIEARVVPKVLKLLWEDRKEE